MINTTFTPTAVPLETNQETLKEAATNTNVAVSIEGSSIEADPIVLSRGTYSVHDEVLVSTPDFYDSAYAKKQPWQTSRTSFGAVLGVHGHYRSLFSTTGNYQNFYDIFAMSEAKSFYHADPTPTFYSELGNCTELTFSPPVKGKQYESYRRFAVESRGYTRAYFYGSAK